MGAASSVEPERADRPLGPAIVGAWREQWRPVAATVVVGGALGILVGGIGGRLAMRVLFLTSDAEVAGVVSDDGFTIGQITGATGFLLLAGLLFGVVGGFAYLALRPFLPGSPGPRAASCGVLAAVVMSPALIHPDGVDFTVLSPRWLAVALFVAIPAGFGLLVGPVLERAIRPGGWARTAPAWVLVPPLLLVLIPGPPLLILGIPVAVVIAAHRVVRRSPRLARIADDRRTTMTVRAALVAVAVIAGADLTRRTVLIV